MVDGKQIEGCHYTNAEFHTLTGNQQAKVIELRRGGNANSTKGGDKLSPTITSTTSLRNDMANMANMADVITASVHCASEENEDENDDNSTISSE